MHNQVYIYAWGNNTKRATLKGRKCIVLHRGKMNSCLIEFLDNKQREITSRNAIRKAPEEKMTLFSLGNLSSADPADK